MEAQVEEPRSFRIILKTSEKDEDPVVLEGWKAYAAAGTAAVVAGAGIYTLAKGIIGLLKD